MRASSIDNEPYCNHDPAAIEVNPLHPRRGSCECGAELWDVAKRDIAGNGDPLWVPLHRVTSWAPMFSVHGEPADRFYGNAQRFATREAADASASARYARWTMAREYRVDPSADAVNYKWDPSHGGDVAISADVRPGTDGIDPATATT